jgi:hypothetical protein
MIESNNIQPTSICYENYIKFELELKSYTLPELKEAARMALALEQ